MPEAARLGVTPARLCRLRGAGALVHLRRGAYALAEAWAAATETERYALRVRAVLRTRERVAASHHAALTLMGLPVWGTSLERIDVVDTGGQSARVRSKAALVVHPRPRGSVVALDELGDPRVSVEAALLQVARGSSPLAFAVALDQALRVGLTTVCAVRTALDAAPSGARWVLQCGDLLGAADPLSPSVEATRLRVLLTDMGFTPRLRVPLRVDGGASIVRPELVIGASIAVARTAYSSAERERLRAVGIVVAQVEDRDLDHPERVAASIAGAMRELEGLRPARARGA